MAQGWSPDELPEVSRRTSECLQLSDRVLHLDPMHAFNKSHKYPVSLEKLIVGDPVKTFPDVTSICDFLFKDIVI